MSLQHKRVCHLQSLIIAASLYQAGPEQKSLYLNSQYMNLISTTENMFHLDGKEMKLKSPFKLTEGEIISGNWILVQLIEAANYIKVRIMEEK